MRGAGSQATPQSGEIVVEMTHPARSVDAHEVERFVQHVADAEGFAVRYVGVVLADHEAVHTLNRDFLGHDWETDVVSFPLQDEGEERVLDGEVYVDLDTAAERAPEFGATFEDEAYRYVVHGLLHLLGYDDATDEERAAMRALEDRYLSAVRPGQ